MENNTTTTPVKAVKSKRGKKLSKAVTAFTVGVALLFTGGTFAVWEGSQSIGQHQTITAGELSIERARSAGSWTLNGNPLSESELSSVKLVPGDTVAYAGTEAPRVVGDTLTGWMYFQGTEAVQNALAGASGATMDWSVAGKQEARKLTSADHLVEQAVTFSVTLDTGSDNAAQALSLDLSGVQIAVSMIKPGGGTTPPPVDGGGEEDASALWVIKDDTVRRAVMDAVGVWDASELTQEHKDHVYSLDIFEITSDADLTELADIPKLEEVDLEAYELTSTQLTSLAKATQLQELRLSLHGPIESDLSELASLQNLTQLEVQGDLERLDGIGQLKKLTNLAIDDVYVRSLDFLDGLTELKELSVDHTSELADISAISNLSALKMLDLAWAESLTDLSPLAGMGIEKLNLSNTGASDFGFLSSLTSLKDLSVLQESFTSLEPLRGAGSLTKLNLHRFTPVTSLEPLNGMTQLEWLTVGSEKLIDGAPLASLAGLTSLDLSGSGITDLSVISGMNHLGHIKVSEKTADITPLRGKANLTNVDLRNAIGITNLEPLRGMTHITRLDVRGTSVTDFSPVDDFDFVIKD